MLISEHESRQTESKSDYIPTQEEDDLCRRVEQMFSEAKRHRSRYDQNWLAYYKFFRGSQWGRERPSYRHAECINFVFQTIQSQTPLLLDTRPRVEFVPTEPEDNEFAIVLNGIIESKWVARNWLEVLAEVILDGHLYGCGISQVCWDKKADLGIGDIDFESCDPFYMYADPMATDCNKKCRYIIKAEPLPIDYVKSLYPDQKEKIKSDIVDDRKGSVEGDLRKLQWRRPPSEQMPMQSVGDIAGDSQSKQECLLITAYFRDEQVKDDKDDEAGEFVRKKVYPKGRKVVICSGAVLEDRENDYEDGEFPYERFVNYILPREFWGMSEVEQLESPQRIFNKLVSFSLDVLTLMGNPVWIVANDSGVDTENLYNRPGLIIEKNPGTEVSRQEGTQLQPYVMQLIDRMQTWFNDVAGTQDVSRGASPGSVTAASAIMSLQEAAQTRIREKARHLDLYLQCVGQHMASRFLQYYSAPRVFRLTGNDNSQKYFKARIETTDEGQKKVVTERWNAGAWEPAGDGEYVLRGKLDVQVATGSTLPFAKAEKESRLLALFDRAIVDDEEVLRALDYPNYQGVLARVNEKKAQAAQAQAEQAPQTQAQQ